MPKGGKLDRCHEHVKDGLEKKGVDSEKADGLAWGICKKRIKDGVPDARTTMEDAKVNKISELQVILKDLEYGD